MNEIVKKMWDKVVEQSLLFIILIVCVYMLWTKQEKTEQRLNTYIQEDHKVMVEVIKENTIVIYRMKELIGQK